MIRLYSAQGVNEKTGNTFGMKHTVIAIASFTTELYLFHELVLII
jgi:hypothetical protein